MRTLLVGLAAAVLSIATPASAAEVFSDNFDSETPGAPASLSNFTVTGTIDVVNASNPYGITVGGLASGNVVDLDGTPGPGRITTIQSFSFNAGDYVSLDFVLGGSQRGGNGDLFSGGFLFDTPTQLLNAGYALNGSSVPTFPNVTTTTYYFSNNLIPGADPFGARSLYFTAGTAGSVKLYFETDSADNVGPLLDNVSLNVTAAVPEPATWLMMILGFGAIGATMRRRRQAPLAFA